MDPPSTNEGKRPGPHRAHCVLLLLLPFVAFGESGNSPLDHPHTRHEFDRASGVAQHHASRRRQLKCAISRRHAATRRCAIETAGSTCNLKGLTQAAHRTCRIREINAKDSLCEADRQEASVLEAKHAAAGDNLKIWAETAAALAGGLGRRIVSPQATIGEWSKREEGRATVATVYESFSEGFDTVDLKAARAFLAA